ncbi:MAG: hypothetical protein WBM66_01845 [Thiothrix litoralis]
MQNNPKRTLEIKIQSEKQAMQASAARFLNAWNKSEYTGEYLTFTSPGMFFEVINARRWDLVIKLQTLVKPIIRDLARQIGRDVRRVHDDIKILIDHGIVEQDAEGVCVPYDEIHADFTLMAAAA